MDRRERLNNRIEEVMNAISDEIAKQLDGNSHVSHIETSSNHIRFHSDLISDQVYSYFNLTSDVVTNDWGRPTGDLRFYINSSILDVNKSWYERKTDITKRAKDIATTAMEMFEWHIDRVVYENKKDNEEKVTTEFVKSLTDGEYSSYVGNVEINNRHSNLIKISASVEYEEENAEEIEKLIREFNEKVSALKNK